MRQKIATERSEMERLEQEIADLRIIHEGLYDSDELWSESSDESLDEEELQDTLQRLIEENKQLEVGARSTFCRVIVVLFLNPCHQG